MKTNTPRFFIFSCFLVLLSLNTSSQINLQVGYGLGLVDLSNAEQILQTYRKNNTSLSTDFKSINYLNTFILGCRQSWQGMSLGIAWKYRPARTDAEGFDMTLNQAFKKEIFINTYSYSLFFETGKKRIQFGTSLDYNILRIKERHTGSSEKLQLSSESQWGSQVYINYHFSTGHSNQISLQAFYFLPWSEFDLSDLQKHLQLVIDPKTQNQSFSHFGISLILSNGLQLYD